VREREKEGGAFGPSKNPHLQGTIKKKEKGRVSSLGMRQKERNHLLRRRKKIRQQVVWRRKILSPFSDEGERRGKKGKGIW